MYSNLQVLCLLYGICLKPPKTIGEIDFKGVM